MYIIIGGTQMELVRHSNMSKQSVLAALVLAVALAVMFYPNVYAWDSSPQITTSQDGMGNTIVTIQFNFAQMSDPPTSVHHPTDFQVRTSIDGSSWTELPSVPLSPWPTSTVFTETYNLGSVSGRLLVQARLKCSIHGWSNWGPDPAISVPEFPPPMTIATAALVLAISLFLFRKKIQEP
jgi:hypothetical protein